MLACDEASVEASCCSGCTIQLGKSVSHTAASGCVRQGHLRVGFNPTSPVVMWQGVFDIETVSAWHAWLWSAGMQQDYAALGLG